MINSSTASHIGSRRLDLVVIVHWIGLLVAAGFMLARPVRAQSVEPARYYTQEIRYLVADASEVFLVWGINNWQNTDSTHRSPLTFVNRNLLYTPFEVVDDSLVASISVPYGTTIEYIFWISKGSDGSIIDFWDSNGKEDDFYRSNALDTGPITVRANLTKSGGEPDQGSLSYAWMVLLAVVAFAGTMLVITRRDQPEKTSLTVTQKIIVAGTTLYLFHFLIRLDIIDFGNKARSLRLLSVGSSDLLFIVGLTTLFLLIGAFVKEPRAKKRVFFAYLVASLVAFTIAMLNIDVVENLGKPFTYQWLYYSGFLGSTEAKNAMAANLSLESLARMAAMIVAMLLLMYSLGVLLRLIQRNSLLRRSTYGAVALLGLTTIGTSGAAADYDQTAGKLSNPITSFLSSVVSSNVNPSLMGIEVPPEFAYQPIVDRPQPVETALVKNVLVIVLESAGAEYFDIYGGQHQVNKELIKLAPQSVVFENAYAHAPATNKAMVSLLASIYPWVSYKSITQELPNLDFPTLASVYKDDGYRTSFFASGDNSFQRTDEFVKNRGFEVVEDYRDVSCAIEFELAANGDGFGKGVDDACLVHRFADWIDEDSSKPFFSMWWTNQAHYPYFFNGAERKFNVSDPHFNRYLNIIEHYDRIIGMAVDTLRSRGLLESTIVAIVGDHGEAFGQHKLYGHASSVFEENIRIPLILVNSTLFHGERHSRISGQIDLPATLLSLTGHPIPNEWLGGNLFDSGGSEQVFFFAPWSNYLFGTRVGNRKVIFNETQGRTELFDLASDPFERDNLYQNASPTVDSLRLQLAGWLQYQDRFVAQLFAR